MRFPTRSITETAMQKRPATTSKPIHELLARRWSTRAFDASRPVSREQLITLLEAGRWAPSCNGDEPWRYLIWDRKRDPESEERRVGKECRSRCAAAHEKNK